MVRRTAAKEPRLMRDFHLVPPSASTEMPNAVRSLAHPVENLWNERGQPRENVRDARAWKTREIIDSYDPLKYFASGTWEEVAESVKGRHGCP
jgi:hypothetical protein